MEPVPWNRFHEWQAMARHTLRDVAIQAGVSKATASRVFNGSVQVDPGTRQRVLDAMAELEYTPSSAARRLSLGRTLTISVVTSFLTRPQAAERLRGVDAVLGDSEFDLLIYNVETVEKRDQYLRGLALAQRTDGLLVISLPAARRGRAAPLVGRRSRSSSSTRTRPRSKACRTSSATTSPAATLGDEPSARPRPPSAIAFVGDEFENPFGFTSSRHRYAGYERALELPASRRDRSSWRSAPTADTRPASWRSGCSRCDDPPSAIFAASDTQALGVLSAAHEAGLRVPDDLSVVGYDDIEIADYVGLTTVRQQLFESGPPRRRAAPRRDPRRVRRRHRPSSWPPRSWSAGRRRHRRRELPSAEQPTRLDHRHVPRGGPIDARSTPSRRARAWMTALAVPALLAGALAGPVAAQEATGDLPTPNCGTEPVELLAYFETGFPYQQALADEFTKQFPNVTWNIREDQFTNLMTQTPRLLSGDNPPDLIRLPTMVDLVQDGLLLEPGALRRRLRLGPVARVPARRRSVSPTAAGRGARVDLYAGGLNKATTGVFYNKEQAAQIGMTEPPATLEEFEGLLAAAKEAGLQPIMQWNTLNSGGGLAFPLQNLMAALGPTTPINEWIFQKEGATIDTPSNLEAAQHLEQWIQAGYFPEDVNAIEYADSNARFGKGEGVFTFNGDWQNAGYDTDAPGNVGFFLFPPAEAGGAHGSMGVARRRSASPPTRKHAGLRRVLPELGGAPTRPPARSS